MEVKDILMVVITMAGVIFGIYQYIAARKAREMASYLDQHKLMRESQEMADKLGHAATDREIVEGTKTPPDRYETLTQVYTWVKPLKDARCWLAPLYMSEQEWGFDEYTGIDQFYEEVRRIEEYQEYEKEIGIQKAYLPADEVLRRSYIPTVAITKDQLEGYIAANEAARLRFLGLPRKSR